MPIIKNSYRNNLQMVCWEQSIACDNPVRVIDAFVDFLNLKDLGFQIKGQSHEGRPAFTANTLLKLYIYGYLNRSRSSRILEKAARTNIELFWLLEQAKPCYKVIADFRKNNRKALEKTFKTFNQFLKGEGLFSSDTVAVDGTKIGAQNSKKNNYNQKKVARHLDYIDKQIDRYLDDLEAADQAEESEQIIAVATKLDELDQRRKKYEAIKEKIESARANNQAQVSTTDPDARALPLKMNIVQMGYNVQTAVDSANNLITNFEVTNENDAHALSKVATAAKEVLGKEKIKVLADKGYDTGSELKKCAANNIETYVAPRQKNTSKKHPDFRKEKFIYDEEKDCYHCPNNKELTSNGNWYKKNSGDHRKVYQVKVYKLPFEVCNACPFKENCAGAANLKNAKGRPIERSEFEPYLEENRERVKLNKALYRTRQQIVEHPFGTIKRQWGYHYTLLKTKENVSGEFALIFTCYNMRRAMSIFGIKGLIERLRAACFHFEAEFWAFLSGFEAFFQKCFLAAQQLFIKFYRRRLNNNPNMSYLW